MTAKIVSALFAVILWFYVVTIDSFTTSVTLPVHYTEPSEGYMVSAPLPGRANVIISGTGMDMFSSYIRGLFRTEQRFVIINLAGLGPGTNQVVIDGEKNIMLGESSNLTVEGIHTPPNAIIDVRIDERVKRTALVAADSLQGYRIEQDYVVVGKTADPEYVLVEGPRETVGKLAMVRPVPGRRAAIANGDTVLTVGLDLPPYSTADPETVDIRFRVEAVERRQFTGVPLRYRGFPRTRPELTPDSLVVHVEGPGSLIDALTQTDIIVSVAYGDYRDAAAAGDSVIAPNVRAPQGIIVERMVPAVLRIK